MKSLLVFLNLVYFGNSNAYNPINDYIDTVLSSTAQMEVRTLGLEPLVLPDFEAEFVDKVKLIGTVHGKVQYSDGELRGLNAVRRVGDCLGPYSGWNEYFINCTLALDSMKIIFKGKLKYGKFPTVSITAKANLTSTSIGVEVGNYATNFNYLRSYKFLKIGQVRTKFSGLGSLNKYLAVLTDGFTDHVRPVFLNAIGQNFQYALQVAIQKVVFV